MLMMYVATRSVECVHTFINIHKPDRVIVPSVFYHRCRPTWRLAVMKSRRTVQWRGAISVSCVTAEWGSSRIRQLITWLQPRRSTTHRACGSCQSSICLRQFKGSTSHGKSCVNEIIM